MTKRRRKQGSGPLSMWLVIALAMSVSVTAHGTDVDGDTRDDALGVVVDPPSHPITMRTGRTTGGPEICSFPCQEPGPYCNSAGRGALAYRPSIGPDPALLAWTTQTTFNDDIVWVCADDVGVEHARCCQRTQTGAINQTIVALAYNDRICTPDTLISGTATNTAGFMYESSLFPSGSPTSTRECAAGDQGEDDLGCNPSPCAFLRRFNFAGLDSGDIANGVTVMEPPGVAPLLVVSADVRLYFVNPASPSCTAQTVDVVGTCQVLDGGVPVSMTGLAWAGGNQVLAVSSFTDQVYRIDVDFTVTPLTCTIVEQCPSPGQRPEAITYDPLNNVVFIYEADLQTIFFQGNCAGGGCTIGPVCGDGILDPGEICDDGNSNPDDLCDANCALTTCGDGILQSPNGTGLGGPLNDGNELCDDGNTDPADQCDVDCGLTPCGDGIVQTPNGTGLGGPLNDGNELCDDGNTDPADLCDANCALTTCGDSIVQSPNGTGLGGPLNDGNELCDDGNADPGDQCDANCALTTCGDGILQSPNGTGNGGLANDGNEACDDGNTTPNDGCTNCTIDLVLSVDWLSIDVTCEADAVRIAWEVGDENTTYGYQVRRGATPSGPFEAVVDPQWATGSYSSYQAIDPQPSSEQPWYVIEELCHDLAGCSTSPAIASDCTPTGSTGGRDRRGGRR